MNRILTLAAIVILLTSAASSPASAQLPGPASVAPPASQPIPGEAVEAPNPPLIEAAMSVLGSPPSASGIVFEANRGQWDDAALFRVHAQGYDAFITRTGIAMVQVGAPLAEDEPRVPGPPEEAPELTKAWATHLRLLDSNPSPVITTSQPTEYHTNYFLGNDPAQWHASVPTYTQVTLHNVYPGIDLDYHASEGDLKYNFIIHPGANSSRIKQQVTGQDQLIVKPNGTLEIQTGLGTIHQGLPLSWQDDGIPVANQYSLEDAIVTYLVGDRDPLQDLIIDPLMYSTFIGGSSNDGSRGMAVDTNGNTYVTGYTSSMNYPTTVGAYDTTFNGGNDVFVAKLNSDGSALAYSTYLGGSGSEQSYGVAVDASGNAYITGSTSSTNYPTTIGAYDAAFNGGPGDVFVTKLNSAGSALSYSTYLGGSGTGNEIGSSIALDGGDNAYITGVTRSTNYPTTIGAFDTTYNGGNGDAFVTKLNSDGSALAYSTYLGGSGVSISSFNDERGFEVAIDANGNAYITGQTASTNYPTTPGAYDTTYNGGGNDDVFVTKLNSAGSALVYSTYLGGSNFDYGYSVAVDASGNAYVTGTTWSTNYPTTLGAYDSTFNGGSGDIFVTKLNSAGLNLAYSTYLGGGSQESPAGVAIGMDGKAYITGHTQSSNYPTTFGAYDTTYGGTGDVIFTKLDGVGSGLEYSTYLGGSNSDYGDDVAIDLDGRAYVTGVAASTNYPTTTGAYDTTHNSLDDVLVFRFDFADPPSEPLNLRTLSGPSRGQITIEWDAPLENGGMALTYKIYSGPNEADMAYRAQVYESLSFIDSGLPDDSIQYYAVQASHPEGYGLFSDIVVGITLVFEPPSAPRNATTVPGPAAGQITLTWQVPAQNRASVTAFNVYRSDGPDGPFTLVGTSPPSSLIYTDSGRTAGQTYYYRVAGQNALGEGLPSSVIAGRSTAAPSPPRSLQASLDGADVVLEWRAPLGDGGSALTSYEIESSMDGSTFAALDSVAASATSFTHSACDPQCYYRVRAVNGVGSSEPSNVAAALPEFSELPLESIRGSTPGAGVGLRHVFPCGEATGSINLATGQFVSSTCLLHVKSPLGLDVSIAATHRSHSNLKSVAGESWDLSLLRRIEVDGNDALLLDGAGREDRFAWNSATSSFTAPSGFYQTLTQEPGDGFTLTAPGGLVERFDASGKRTEVEDAVGNSVTFAYDLQGRPLEVRDNTGRSISFQYDAEGLVAINDFAGRAIRFTHDEDGNLESILPPAGVPGSGHHFTYNDGHDLLTAVDPNGQTYLRNAYDAQGRVASQGNGVGTSTLTYVPAQARTEVRDASGNLVAWTYDQGSRVAVSKTEFANRGIRPHGPDSYITAYLANSQGEVTRITSPDGSRKDWTYDHANANPLARGNLLRYEETPVPGSAASPTVWTYAYEPAYQLLRSQTSPLGNDAAYVPPNGGANSAERFTTTYWYGHDEATQGDLNDDGEIGSPLALPVRIDEPTANAGGAPHPLLSGSQQRSSTYQYNERGQITQSIKPDGSSVTYDYFEDGEQSFTRPLYHLQRVEHNADLPAGPSGFAAMAFAAESMGPQPLATGASESYEYDEAGNPAVLIDGNGQATTKTYDALNRVTRVAAPVAGVETNYTYDGNGNLLAVATTNAVQQANGTFTIDPGHPVSTDTFEYNVLGQVTARTLDATRPTGAPESTQPEELAEEFLYDATGNLILHRRNGAVNGTNPADVTTFDYDERGLLVSSSVGGRNPQFLATQDANLTGLEAPFTLYLHVSVEEVAACPPNAKLGPAESCAQGPESDCSGGRNATLDGQTACLPPSRYPKAAPGVDLVGSLPSARTGTSAVWDAGRGKAYVFGGATATGVLDDIVGYDPETQASAVVAHLPSGRWAASAVFDGTYAYVFGGCADAACTSHLDDVVRFDLGTGAVSTVSSLPVALAYASAVWDGSMVYVFGGCESPCTTARTEILAFDPATGTVEEIPDQLPQGHFKGAAVWDHENGEAILFGGAPGDAILTFDPVTGQITTSAEVMPPARSGHAAAWDGQHAYVFGGLNGATSLAEILRYDPALDQLVSLTLELPSGASGLSGVWTTDSALVFGGTEASGVSDAVHRFRPLPAPPTEPQALLARPGPQPGQTTLTWQAPSSIGSTELLAYKVYHSDSEDGPYALVGSVPASQLHFVDEGRTAGEFDHYVVSAVNGDFEGPQSTSAYVVATPAPPPIEVPVEVCSDGGLGAVVDGNPICPPAGTCPAGTLGAVVDSQPACAWIYGCPAGEVGVLVNDEPTCVAVPSVCLTTCLPVDQLVCYLPEPCLHIVPGILAIHIGADGIGAQAGIEGVVGPIVVYVPLGGLPYHPGTPTIDPEAEAPEPDPVDPPEPSWQWSFVMDETPSNDTGFKAGPNVGEAPAKMAWEWTPDDDYDFTDEGAQLVFWAVQAEEAAEPSSTWNARVYSDGLLVASTDPTHGVTSTVLPGSVPREYRLDLGRITASGSTLRVELDLGSTPAGRLVLFDGAEVPSRLEIGNVQTTTTEYDAAGRPTVVTDASGAQTAIEYDGHGRPVSVTDPAGTRHASSYDPSGRPVASETYGRLDVDGPEVLLQRIASHHDEAGRPFRVDRAFFDPATGTDLPDGDLIPGDGLVSTIFDYDAEGRLTKVIDDNAGVSSFTYDGRGNLIGQQDALGNRIEYAYDDAGNLVQQTDIDLDADGIELPGRTTRFVYDEQNLLTRTIDPLGRVQRFGYDSRGNLAWQTDARNPSTVFDDVYGDEVNDHGNRVTYLYDAQDRLVRTSHELRDGGDGSGALLGFVNTTQEWDGNGRLVRQTDDSGANTTYEYDSFGRLASTTFADGTAESYEYDVRDLLVGKTDANNNEIKQVYDAASRLLSRTATGPSAWSTAQAFEYDGLGRLTRASEAGSDVRFTYDSLGRAAQETQNGLAASRMFDGVGNPLTLTYPNGRVVSREFDALGRLTEASGPSDVLASFTYEGRGRVVSRTAGNGVVSSYAYDAAEQVTSIDHALPDLALPLRFEYGYDGNGNRIEELFHHAPDWSKAASFDSLGRVVAFERSNVGSLPSAPNPLEGILPTSATWTLDGANEWDELAVVQDGVASTQTRAHDSLHAIESITLGAATTAYSSDANGNRLEDGHFAYTWDALNRLREVHDAATDDLVATYEYDALGRRTLKVVDGEATRFLYDGADVIEERDGDGVLLRQFVHGQATDQPILMDAAGERFYYVQDALGSVTGLMDEDGALVEGYLYDAYGHTVVLQPGVSGEVTWTADDVAASSSALGNPYGFTGQRLDTETGLMHYRARYYDAETGSFLSRDTIGIWEDRANLGNGYTYVGNNPVMSTDPSGECGSWKNGYIGGCLWGIGTAIGNAGISLGKTYLDCQNNGLKTCGKNVKSSVHGQATAFKESLSTTGSCLTGKSCQDLCTGGSALNFVANLSCGYHACGQETHMGRQLDCYISSNIDFALTDAALTAPVAGRITGVTNPVPTRLARVVDEDYANGPRLYRHDEPQARVFVTAADDIAGIQSSDQLARRLTLVDDAGIYRKGPFAVFEFDTPGTGLGSPINRLDPGFVGRGRTAGGAREFDLLNYRLDQLNNMHRRFLE